jgi:pimeloyl-ACP methyl ester carboxylesterase
MNRPTISRDNVENRVKLKGTTGPSLDLRPVRTWPCLACLLLTFLGGTLSATENEYLVGTAKIDITPDYPVRLSGFGFRRTESEGITQRIWAKALAVSEDDSSPAVLITVDNLGIPGSMVESLSQRLQDSLKLTPERLTVTATHTHTAPMLSGVAPTLFGLPISREHQSHIDQYTQELERHLETVATEAIKNLQPGTLEFGIGQVAFAKNRRTKGGPVDHDLPTLFVKNSDGKIIAIYTNYACHCVTLSHNHISGDWAGYAQTAIEARYPGSTTLIAIGCGADANPDSGVVGDDTATAARQGNEIADGIARILDRPRLPVTGSLSIQSETISLDFATPPSKSEWQERAQRTDAVGYHAKINLARLEEGDPIDKSIDYRIQTWHFGDSMAWVFLPGEVVVDYSIRLKRELDESKVWITAYANDSPCYIPSERILEEGGYEGGDAMVYYDRPGPFASGLENRIVETVHTLLPDVYRQPNGIDQQPFPGKRSEWHGFSRFDFKFDTRDAIVVVPRKTAQGKPWIWRARFFGHEPQLDIALLEKGYHLVYLDVANLFGSPSAVAHWDRFYDYLVMNYRFHKKALLEGMSRGGLIIYNWANANPNHVAGIYADAPVLDFKSWPGGSRGKTNQGQQRTWDTLLKAYGFRDDAEALAFAGNPVDHTNQILNAQIPLFHICGDSDIVVPYSENTGLFKSRYQRAGGSLMHEIVKPHIGHHPHSVPNPRPLVEFVEACYKNLVP